MRRSVSTLLAVVASLAVCVTTGLSARLSANARPSEQQRTSAPQRSAAATPQKNPIPMSEASLRAGRAVYAKICRNCHGLQGKGDGVSAPPGSKPANLVDSEWKYGSTDAEIFKTIKGGVKPYDVMEPWGKKLSDTEIWNTINYIRDLAAKQAKK